jgi:ABC-type polysaccharide/polyol phosphate transport system ATPase subunit
MNSLTVEDLGKRYLLGRQNRSARARATLDLKFATLPLPWGKKAPTRELWALRHVSFVAKAGTTLGVVGPNGAGKSTLLKILARVIRPTEGRVVGRGRVVSLLELGAGFNQDLSARDNIYMNAAMHGIPKHEVDARLDDIVDFAEVGQFLDSVLRHYSSGMYLRLAFSVAINMSPDILLADEILAVGDIAFQERCLQRVAEEAKKGLTVLFVSHDMAAIARLCDQALWLNGGEVVQLGPAAQVVGDYEDAALSAVRASATDDDDRAARASRFLEVVGIRLVSASDGRVIGAAPVAEDVIIRIRVKVVRLPMRVRASLGVYVKNVHVFQSAQPEPVEFTERGVFDILARIPANILAETGYTVDISLAVEGQKSQTINLPDALSFMTYGDSYATLYKGGVVMPRLTWSVMTPEPEPVGEARG